MNQIITDTGSVQFQPLHDRLLVRRIEEPRGLLWSPDIAQENSKRAEVLAMGKKVYGVAIGDIVLLPGIASKYPDWEQSNLMLIQQADIGGILQP